MDIPKRSKTFQPNKKDVQLPWLNFQVVCWDVFFRGLLHSVDIFIITVLLSVRYYEIYEKNYFVLVIPTFTRCT